MGKKLVQTRAIHPYDTYDTLKKNVIRPKQMVYRYLRPTMTLCNELTDFSQDSFGTYTNQNDTKDGAFVIK